MNSIREVLIKSFHLSVHSFRFRWTVQDLKVFLVLSNSPLAVKGLILKCFARLVAVGGYFHIIRKWRTSSILVFCPFSPESKSA